ncbi:hypothetical protein [Streptomyces sp. JNUCC 63]
MTSTSWDRSRRIAAAASVLIVAAVAAGMLVLALSVSVPEAWWPRTGQAFASDARPARDQDPCDVIVGPAKAYCERGYTASASGDHHDAAGAAWRLVPAGAGLAALVMWRRRSTAGRRRA